MLLLHRRRGWYVRGMRGTCRSKKRCQKTREILLVTHPVISPMCCKLRNGKKTLLEITKLKNNAAITWLLELPFESYMFFTDSLQSFSVRLCHRWTSRQTEKIGFAMAVRHASRFAQLWVVTLPDLSLSMLPLSSVQNNCCEILFTETVDVWTVRTSRRLSWCKLTSKDWD